MSFHIVIPHRGSIASQGSIVTKTPVSGFVLFNSFNFGNIQFFYGSMNTEYFGREVFDTILTHSKMQWTRWTVLCTMFMSFPSGFYCANCLAYIVFTINCISYHIYNHRHSPYICSYIIQCKYEA